MADAGLFVGWGAPVRGREAKGLAVFNDAIAYYGRLEQAGEIQSFEVVFLDPHGGELAGFALIRGLEEQIAALTASEEFLRLNTRASLIVEDLGIVGAAIGDAIPKQLSLYQEAIGELA